MNSSQPTVDPAHSPVPKPRLTSSQVKRAGQNVRGMVISVVATLAIALVVILLNPPSEAEPYDPNVDVATTAQQADAVAGFTAAAPEVPADWTANYARWNGAGRDQVEFWEAGYLTTEQEFVGFKQTVQANPTWLSQQMDNAPATGTRAVDGTQWDLYEPIDGDIHLVGEVEGTTVLISASGGLDDLDTVAAAIQHDLKEG